MKDKRQTGMVLLHLMVLIAVMMVAMAGVVLMSSAMRMGLRDDEKTKQMQYAAEAGLEAALAILNREAAAGQDLTDWNKTALQALLNTLQAQALPIEGISLTWTVTSSLLQPGWVIIVEARKDQAWLAVARDMVVHTTTEGSKVRLINQREPMNPGGAWLGAMGAGFFPAGSDGRGLNYRVTGGDGFSYVL
ncbi:hypothetical protein [Heliophilum fasciatum]|uniref:Uncharacterized protein n=1 Tax=Heliophilum fasciatum TaxID=35700 RepID=A0A4R2RSE1_9FIRM|nr:hypothetical protein [Heliophilum fasciatum]MCW2277313.1 type II secretory pathway pseudopilin PulG [Heliophilum fasciatum]TCP67150.1 hypothetical protein EDD73_10545 [Heliophilum fasciatum]